MKRLEDITLSDIINEFEFHIEFNSRNLGGISGYNAHGDYLRAALLYLKALYNAEVLANERTD